MLDLFVNLIINTITNFANTDAGMLIFAAAVVCASFGIVKRLWSSF